MSKPSNHLLFDNVVMSVLSSIARNPSSTHFLLQGNIPCSSEIHTLNIYFRQASKISYKFTASLWLAWGHLKGVSQHNTQRADIFLNKIYQIAMVPLGITLCCKLLHLEIIIFSLLYIQTFEYISLCLCSSVYSAAYKSKTVNNLSSIRVAENTCPCNLHNHMAPTTVGL